LDIDLGQLERQAVTHPGIRLGLTIIFARFNGLEYDWGAEMFKPKS